MELIECWMCKHDTPSDLDPGKVIKTALIRARNKPGVCVCVKQEGPLGILNETVHIVLVT